MNQTIKPPEAAASDNPVSWWMASISTAPQMQAFEAWMDVCSEAQSFYADRIQTDVATQHALLHCTNPIDAQVIVMRHMHKMMEDYHREAGRLVSLMHTVPGAAAVMDE